MENTDNLISALDSSCKVAERTLSQKLLPSLNRPINSSDGVVNAIDILDNFSTCAKQIDGVWNAMKPQFCWSIVIPKDLPPNNFALIPELLSTYIAPEVSEAIIEPKKSANSFENILQLTRDDELELNKLIREHNEDISAIISGFGQAVQGWKAQNAKQRQDKKQQRVREKRAAVAAAATAAASTRAAVLIQKENNRSDQMNSIKSNISATATSNSSDNSNSKKRGIGEVEPTGRESTDTDKDNTQASKRMKPSKSMR